MLSVGISVSTVHECLGDAHKLMLSLMNTISCQERRESVH